MRINTFKRILILFLSLLILLSFFGCRKRILDDKVTTSTKTTTNSNGSNTDNTTEATTKRTNAVDSNADTSTIYSKTQQVTNKDTGNSSKTENSSPVKGNSGNNTATTANSSKGDNVAGIGNGAGAIGIVQQKNQKVLSNAQGSLYPCEWRKVYFELETDYVTVNSNSPINKMINNSAGENVAAGKGKSAISNTSSWVPNLPGDMNPTLIVKVVSSSVLGSSVTGTVAAQNIKNAILARIGWSNINAIKSSKVLIVSTELLNSDEGKLALEMYMAKENLPELFTTIDVDEEYRQMLAEEGRSTKGVFSYK